MVLFTKMEPNWLINTNKWPRGMNQTSFELFDNFSKLLPPCEGICAAQKSGFFANVAPGLSHDAQINTKNLPKYVKWTFHKMLD